MNTDNYIKMMEMAEEIQRLCKKVTGDCIYFESKKEINVIGMDEFYWLENFGSGKPAKEWVKSYWEGDRPRYYGNKGIYLPTLEQLFEMAFNIDTKHRVQLSYRINECDERGFQLDISQFDPQDPNIACSFFKIRNYEEEYFSDSIKGCLLQHIYFIKYHKVWTGEKWKEVKEN